MKRASVAFVSPKRAAYISVHLTIQVWFARICVVGYSRRDVFSPDAEYVCLHGRRAILRSLAETRWLRRATLTPGDPMHGASRAALRVNSSSHSQTTSRWPPLFQNDDCYHAKINLREGHPCHFRIPPAARQAPMPA